MGTPYNQEVPSRISESPYPLGTFLGESPSPVSTLQSELQSNPSPPQSNNASNNTGMFAGIFRAFKNVFIPEPASSQDNQSSPDAPYNYEIRGQSQGSPLGNYYGDSPSPEPQESIEPSNVPKSLTASNKNIITKPAPPRGRQSIVSGPDQSPDYEIPRFSFPSPPTPQSNDASNNMIQDTKKTVKYLSKCARNKSKTGWLKYAHTSNKDYLKWLCTDSTADKPNPKYYVSYKTLCGTSSLKDYCNK